MGRSTKVIIKGREFASKKAAVGYFMNRRDEVKASGPVTQGAFFDELKDLYSRYCCVSPGWGLNGRNIIAFVVIMNYVRTDSMHSTFAIRSGSVIRSCVLFQ